MKTDFPLRSVMGDFLERDYTLAFSALAGTSPKYDKSKLGCRFEFSCVGFGGDSTYCYRKS